MPFVRFSRDRRGYEHVYLIEPVKERGRSRVLYWFRTPPGVKVGRNPFDAATQRVLEQQNPDVHFDWAQIVAAKPPPVAPVESWREKRRLERAIKKARASETIETETPQGQALDDETPPPVELEEGVHPDLGDVVLLDTDAPLDTDAVSGDEELDEEFVTRGSGGPEDQLPAPPTDNVTAPVPGGLPEGERRRKRRRRRRGRRRPGEPVQPASTSPGNGSLDPPVEDDETSNDG